MKKIAPINIPRQSSTKQRKKVLKSLFGNLKTRRAAKQFKKQVRNATVVILLAIATSGLQLEFSYWRIRCMSSTNEDNESTIQFFEYATTITRTLVLAVTIYNIYLVNNLYNLRLDYYRERKLVSKNAAMGPVDLVSNAHNVSVAIITSIAYSKIC